MPEIISRKEARERGLKWYFTGKPCPQGHIDEREVGNCHCVVCRNEYVRSERSKKYFREYQVKNRKKINKYYREYYEGNLEKCRAWIRKSGVRHRSQRNERERARREKIGLMIEVLRKEMPELLKEFGL
jgi:hypothetical protein